MVSSTVRSFTSKLRKYRRRGVELLLTLLPHDLWQWLFRRWLESIAKREPKMAMRSLLEVNDDLAKWIDQVALRYDDGVHVKHRLTRYHDFFVERIGQGERVLDIGCGKGEMTYDIAVRAGALVTGIDFSPGHLAFARSRFAHPNVTYIEGDALTYLPAEPFDVVVLSNVIEHIEDRVAFLRRVQEHVRPDRYLFRVPMINRHWLVPLRKELDMFYFSDPTHYTEYTQQSFEEELQAAGLAITHLQINWGEIWAEAKPADSSSKL